MYSKKTSVIKTVTFLKLKIQRMTSIPECEVPFEHMSTIWIIFLLFYDISFGTDVRK